MKMAVTLFWSSSHFSQHLFVHVLSLPVASDTLMSNLDPVETPALNLESVSGLQSQHLYTIMHIAFLRDSRARGDSDANR